MNKLIIAEKPMLARDIARVMCGKSGKMPVRGNGFTVVSCAGHLLELEEPEKLDKKWKEWSLETLPIHPKAWKKKVAKGKKELVDQIKTELAKCDSVIHAGDPDDEGQLIVDEVLDFLKYKGKVERVYVNDSIDKNIKKAFTKLVDNNKCRAVGEAALARQIADFTFGANESRLACLRCGKNVSVGRVQTPTLGLVVARDLAIENHVVRKFYELMPRYKIDKTSNEVDFMFVPNKDLLKDEKHIFDKSVLDSIKGKLPKSFKEETKITQERKAPPLPYNLTKLQTAMSKKYGYSAQTTLNTTQSLRDKYKAITYNRTDCQYLSEEHYKDAKNVIDVVFKNLNLKDKIDLKLHHYAFNDKNISAHHAIIPQEIKLDINKMSEQEKNVYKEICLAYINLFKDTAVFDVSTTIHPIAEGEIKYVAKKLIVAGGKENQEKEDDKDVGKFFIEKGKHSFSLVNSRIEEKETNPPKPYTEGTLIADMASIAKYCKDPKIKEILKKKDKDKKGEHGGIGTTATRGNIIENLKKRGFLFAKGKTIRSTDLGRAFYELVPENIKTADVTAIGWLIQSDVAEGKAGVRSVADHVVKTFLEHKDSAYLKSNLGGNTKEERGVCPVCGQPVVESGKILQCSSNKSKKKGDKWVQVAGCGFKFYPYVAKKKLTKTQITKILNGQTIELKGLKSKAGKTFSAKAKLGNEKNGFYGVDLVFD